MDLSKISPAPWVAVENPQCDSAMVCYVSQETVEDESVCCAGLDVYHDMEKVKVNAQFIALARNAFAGDPEALAWWEANRVKVDHEGYP